MSLEETGQEIQSIASDIPRARFLELKVLVCSDGTATISSRALKMEITEGTLGSAFRHFANELKRKTVKELKEALE